MYMLKHLFTRLVKKRFITGLLMALTQTGYAINVTSEGDTVLIEDAISKSGVQAFIHLVEMDENGRSQLIPLEQAEGIRYELNGRDIRVFTASAGGRYQAISIVRQENGNRQSMRISIGSHSRANIISGSGSSSSSSSISNSISNSSSTIRQSSREKPRTRPTSRQQGGGSWVNQVITNEDLSASSFAGAAVVNTRFDSVEFGNANFSGSSMTSSQFLSSEFGKADFRGSQLVNVKFEHSDLRSANFQGARMVNVDFHQSDLSGAIWQNGKVCQPGSIGKCRL